MTHLERVVADVRAARRVLARLPGDQRDAALIEMAEALERRCPEILAENAQDIAAARRSHTAAPLIDRLLLDEHQVRDMATSLRAVAALPDPIGVVDQGRRLPNGLELIRRRTPLGVIAVIYEGRPNVTADAAALCLKSGNAVILRGSSLASRTNLIIAEVLTGALIEAGVPRWALALLGSDRQELRQLVQMEGAIDLVIPRGGEELKSFLKEHSRVPVIYAASGNNHVYVHADADPEKAVAIALNAKAQRPSVCNAAETLLVHRDAAPVVLPLVVASLKAAGVALRIDRVGLDLLGEDGRGLAEATDIDYATEYLDLILAVRVVDSLDRALEHIERYGSGHSEAIVTRSLEASRAFREGVDAAVVFVNASTRFTDGGQFGMGAEIAISTQKLHARGPIGLAELTTYTYLVTGDGHVR